MALSDVTLTEARTLSGKKVNLIMASNRSNSLRSGSPRSNTPGRTPSPALSLERGVKTVILEQQHRLAGLHHAVASESPVKKVSDIIIKPKVGYFIT